MGALSRRRLFGAAGAAAGLAALRGPLAAASTGASPAAPPPAGAGSVPPAHTPPRPPGSWRAVAQDVRGEYRWAWRNYVARAFGQDDLTPVTGGYQDFFAPGHPVALSMVEALDTLWLMELDDELHQAIRWLEQHADYDIDASFQVFETTIRMVGGLLAGYHCTGERVLLDLAEDLAQRLLPAFTSSPTGLPYRFVNLHTGAISDPDTNLAEIGTYLPEFGILSRWTGDRRFYDAAKRAYQVSFAKRSSLDLLPYGIDASTGEWTNRTATIGPPADSYYEYLWGSWALLGDRDCKHWYDIATAAILARQSDTVDGHLWFKQVDAFTGELVDRTQSELASYYAGLLSNSGQDARAAAYQESWSAVQDRYGVLPEGIDYTTFAATSVGNQLRPEFVDSALKLWINTGDERYRRQAFTHYTQMKRTSKVRYGYTILDDVTANPPKQGDFTPGYWWAEQTKYYWLIFGDARRFDYRNHFLSTEGKLLRGARG